MTHRLLLLLASLLYPCLSFAQDNASTRTRFSVGGEIRYRSELSARDLTPHSDPTALHLLRTRLGLSFRPQDDLEAFVEVQDAREFGGLDPTAARGTQDGSADAIDFHQAYFTVRNVLSSPFQLKVGRQKLDYGNTRLIGASDWGAIGRTFDAAVLSYERGGFAGDVFVAKLTSDRAMAVSQNLYGSFVTAQASVALKVDAFALLDNNTEPIETGPSSGLHKLSRQTAGMRAYGLFGRFEYDLEGIYQWGYSRKEALPEERIKAYLLAAEAKYKVIDHIKVGALWNMLSGDSDPADRYSRTFNTLFATNHSKYGVLDLFPGIVPAAGFTDFGISAESTTWQALTLRVELHHFEAGAGIPTGSREMKSYGEEASIQATYRYNKNLSIAGGGATFREDDAFRAVGGEQTTRWLFLMVTVKF